MSGDDGKMFRSATDVAAVIVAMFAGRTVRRDEIVEQITLRYAPPRKRTAVVFDLIEAAGVTYRYTGLDCTGEQLYTFPRAWPPLEDVIDKHLNLSGLRSNAWECSCGAAAYWAGDSPYDGGEVSHADHQAAVWREVCTIRLVEELGGLPVGSVVRHVNGDVSVKMRGRHMDSWQSVGDDDAEGGAELPALLVWHPGWEAR